MIRITAKQKAEGESHAHHDQAAAMAATGAADAVIKAGDLELSAASTKACCGSAVGGGFVTIKNNGASDDKLVSVSSPLAGRAEIHEMAMVNDVMKMRKLNDGIAIRQVRPWS